MSSTSPLNGRRGVTIAVTSGKGGVGKTALTVNLAIALAQMDLRVGILDADFGLGNVDVMCGLTPLSHIGSVLSGEKAIGEIGATTVCGVRVFPAGNGVRALTSVPGGPWARLQSGIEDLSTTLDYLLVDTGPGIGDTALRVARATDRALVVTTCEPTALVDAYAMTKLLLTRAPQREVGLVVNMARDAEQGRHVARQLALAVQQFLGASIRYYGHVERDARVAESVEAQRPLMSLGTECPAARAYDRLARRIAPWMPPAAREVAAPMPVGMMSAEEFARTEARSCA
ncbi:MAG: P-loop NTPase [Acidobacteria bacterium]|nr:P-loop NTPase [Acidobacteriota bacterium]